MSEALGGISVFSVVALLRDLNERGLGPGQFGAVVEEVDEESALVEITDDKGRAYAVVTGQICYLLLLKIALEK